MTPLYAILACIAILRLAELAVSVRNTRRLKAEGAIEIGAGHYPLFILLHSSWLLAILCFTPPDTPADPRFLVLVILTMLARFWVIATLGRFWTTRIITLPGVPLVTRGPYRYFRHPNYLIVVVEVAALPMVFHDVRIALIWSMANVMLLCWRISKENAALQSRRHLYGL